MKFEKNNLNLSKFKQILWVHYIRKFADIQFSTILYLYRHSASGTFLYHIFYEWMQKKGYVIVFCSKSIFVCVFFAGLGICMIRDSNTAMLGQYFKKKRPFVEMILACSSGLGHSLICHLLSKAIKWVQFLNCGVSFLKKDTFS